MFSALNVEKIAASIEKATFDFCREINGAPAKNWSGPENRDASILVGKHIANAMIFSIAFDAFDGQVNCLQMGLAGWLAGLGWAGWADSL